MSISEYQQCHQIWGRFSHLNKEQSAVFAIYTETFLDLVWTHIQVTLYCVIVGV